MDFVPNQLSTRIFCDGKNYVSKRSIFLSYLPIFGMDFNNFVSNVFQSLSRNKGSVRTDIHLIASRAWENGVYMYYIYAELDKSSWSWNNPYRFDIDIYINNELYTLSPRVHLGRKVYSKQIISYLKTIDLDHVTFNINNNCIIYNMDSIFSYLDDLIYDFKVDVFFKNVVSMFDNVILDDDVCDLLNDNKIDLFYSVCVCSAFIRRSSTFF